jgi:hypothetical protein
VVCGVGACSPQHSRMTDGDVRVGVLCGLCCCAVTNVTVTECMPYVLCVPMAQSPLKCVGLRPRLWWCSVCEWAAALWRHLLWAWIHSVAHPAKLPLWVCGVSHWPSGRHSCEVAACDSVFQNPWQNDFAACSHWPLPVHSATHHVKKPQAVHPLVH